RLCDLAADRPRPGGHRPHRLVYRLAPVQGACRPGHRLVYRPGVAGDQNPAAHSLPVGVRPGLHVPAGRGHQPGSHLRRPALCVGLAGLLRRQLLRHPAAQRTERRMIWQFAACLPFFLFCALSVPYLLNHWFAYGIRPILLLLICAAGVGLIALQVWLMKENKQSAAELDDLLGRIEAAGAGRLEGAPPLPEESDFHDAAEQLSHMEAGLRTALDERTRSARMKVEVIANVSHDPNAPLTSIIRY